MRTHSLKWPKIFAGGLIILFLLVTLCLPFPVIVLSTQQGSTALLVPMVFEKNFTLEYLHSVQKTPVQENLTLAPENKLLLTSTYYQSLGVGLPFLPEEGKLVNDHGIFKLTGLNRLYDNVCLGYMPLAKHALLYHGNRYDFKDYFLPGTIIKIEIKELTPAAILWQASHCEREVNVD